MVGAEKAEHLLRRLIRGASDGDVGGLLAASVSAPGVVDRLRPLADATGWEISWIGVNEQRVDAGVVDGRREWRVVYFLAPDGRVTEVFVYERPQPFDGIDGGRAIVVNGPSGSGKSSLMEAIVDIADTPWVMFDEPWLGSTKRPYLIWRDVAPVLHRGFLRGIGALASTGNQVVLPSGGHPQEWLVDAMEGIPTLYVGLDCPLEVLLGRERGRSGRWGGLAEASLGVHDGWSYDMRLDTTTAPPDALARQTLNALHHRFPPTEHPA